MQREGVFSLTIHPFRGLSSCSMGNGRAFLQKQKGPAVG